LEGLVLPLADTLFEAVSDEDGVSLGVEDTDMVLLADTVELCGGEAGHGGIGRRGTVKKDPALAPPQEKEETLLQSATAARTAVTDELGDTEDVVELLPVLLALCVAVSLADCREDARIERTVRVICTGGEQAHRPRRRGSPRK
jgi:hypothetical protein